MADHKKIAQYLEHILKSQCFAKSATNRELLKYLVESTIKGESPKEFQIAYEVFGKKVESEKDFNIRVYILNLRKKLDEYYSREGKDDEIRLEIPKGKYQVVFKTNVYRIYRKKIYLFAPYLLLFSLILLVLTYLLYEHRQSPDVARKSIWKELIESDKPVLIVLGDHYFFRVNGNNPVQGSLRNNQINSDEDFDRFLTENPHLINQFEKTNQTYINIQAPFGLYRIMNLLGGGLSTVEMTYTSKLRWDDVRGKHVIFVGSYKTQNLLQAVNQKLGIGYDIQKGVLHYSTQDSTLVFKNHSEDDFTSEYASFLHFVTADGRKIIFFMCDSDVGNIATLKFLTSEKGLDLLERQTKKAGSTSYKAVFEVKGRQHTEFETKLLRVDPIVQPITEIWP